MTILCNDYTDTNIFSLPNKEQIIPEAWVMEAIYQKAKIFERMDSLNLLEESKKHLINESYQKAIFTLDLLRDSYLDDDSKYEMTESMSNLLNDVFQYNFRQYQKVNNASSLNTLFEIAQLKKAFVFKSSISLRKAFEQSGVPKDVANQYFKIRTEVVQAQKKISAQVDSLKYLENVITETYPSSKRLIVSNPLSVQEVQESLLAGQVMLHYVQLKSNKLFCIIIGQTFSDIVYQDLPDHFEQIISQYNLVLTKSLNTEKEFIQNSHSIYNYCIDDVIKKLDETIQTITIIPDGDLQLIAFDNLFHKPSDSWSDVDAMLLSRYSFNYLYHTNQIQSQSENPKHLNSKVVVGYDYKKEESQEFSENKSRGQVFQELLYVASEVYDISEILNTESFLNEQVNKNKLKGLLSTSDLFHFVGHAWSDDTVRNSYIILQPELGYKYDSLSYNEIIGLNLDNELVTLSACRTNQGESIKSEGVLSLSRAFIESGVKSTLGSSWNAPDRISKQLLVLFYENLNLGMNKSASLNKAKLDFLTNDDLSSPSERSPAFWSNWKLYGDLTSIKTDGHPPHLLWVSGVAILLFFGIFILRKNRTNVTS